MNAAVNAQMNSPVPAARQREATRWIARQLCWERTLDALRGERQGVRARRAA
jgi:hypothetical protein